MKYCIIVPWESYPAQLHAVKTFAGVFGGATVQDAVSFWQEPTADLADGLPPPVVANRNTVIWAFGPAGREDVLKTLAADVRELADQDAVMFWTEAGDAQFVSRPPTAPGRVQLAPENTPAPSLN